jgi:hypothetical protein
MLISPVILQFLPMQTTQDAYSLCLPNHILPYRLEKKIVKLLRKHRLIYGSDASVKDGRGSFAWGIMDRQNPTSTLIQFNAQLHGDSDQIHSTRGEMFGLLACMKHIEYIKQKFKIRLTKK